MALEADTQWLDRQGNQIAAQTLEMELMPSVILTIKQETGRSLISNAPIQFSFVKGGGVLTSPVNTNDFGQANCAIAGIDNPQAEQVVKASLVYKVRGFTYAFSGVQREFVYRPPLQKATILVMEQSRLGVASDPFVVDPVFQELKAHHQALVKRAIPAIGPLLALDVCSQPRYAQIQQFVEVQR